MKPKQAFISLIVLFIAGTVGSLYHYEIIQFNVFNTEQPAIESNVTAEPAEESEVELKISSENDETGESKIVDMGKVNIRDINKEDIDNTVTIEGIVKTSRNNNDGHIFIYLEDESGKILVPVFESFDVESEMINVGNKLEIRGKVDVYNDELEVIPLNKESIKLIDNISSNSNDNIVDDSQPADNELDDTKESSDSLKNHTLFDQIGTIQTITATVETINESSDGHIFTILSLPDEEKIDMPLFNNMSPGDLNLVVNETLEVTGGIELYENRIEIKPSNLSDIKLLSRRSSSDEYNTIQSINKQNDGNTVTVKGKMNDLFVSQNDNVFVNVTDNTGSIRLVMFGKNNDNYEDRKIFIENSIENENLVLVEGEVNVYEGELQLIINKVWGD